MRSAAAVLLLAGFAGCGAQKHQSPIFIDVPFVGCASAGQVGMEPPFGTTKRIWATSSEAERLAYYSAGELGVVAPRGWHCLGLNGSSGSSLRVAPIPFGYSQLVSEEWSGHVGPGVEIQWRDGGTSGSYTVAQFAALAFPTRIDLALETMRDFDTKPSAFHFGPYPEDKLMYRTPTALRYTTPARMEGLGTRSMLRAGDRPIEGVAILTEDPDLLHLAIRLPDKLASLSSAIMRQFEADAAQQHH